MIFFIKFLSSKTCPRLQKLNAVFGTPLFKMTIKVMITLTNIVDDLKA